MKKYINIFIGLAALMAILVACNEDYIDLLPHDAIPTEKAFENLNDFEVALNGVYSSYKSSNSYGEQLSILPGIMGDLVLAVNGYSNTYGEMYKWAFNAGTDEVEGQWARNYITISRANNIIGQVDKLDEPLEVRNNIKGQALLGRSMAHFNLVRFYAPAYSQDNLNELGVPYMARAELGKPERNTVGDVYEQLLFDTYTAKRLIANEGVQSDYYFSKNLSEAFLARVYLTMQEWDSAIHYASSVINSSVYELADTGSGNFSMMWINDVGPEIIWTCAFTPTDIGGAPGARFVNDGQVAPLPDYIPAQWFLDLYDDRDDIRWDAYFRHDC
jgi:hypothetical protein